MMLKVKELKENIKEELNDNMYNSKVDGGAFCDYSGTKYLGDIISEISDSQVDIYTYDLLDWLKYNYSDVEEANREFGTCEDIIKQVQQAQFWRNEQDIYENIENMLLLYVYDVIYHELEIEEISETLDYNIRTYYIEELKSEDYLPTVEQVKDYIEEVEE